MSLELERALRSAYGEIDSSESGLPSRDIGAEIWRSLQPHGQALFITALGTAARTLIFPQVAAGAVDRCVKAIEATRALLGTQNAPLPLEVNDLLHATPSATTANAEQLLAQQCLGHTLAFCLAPTPDRFTAIIDAFAASQRAEYSDTERARDTWIGWLDDVVSRSDRFSGRHLLDLLEQAARGTILGIPGTFRWEGTCDKAGTLNVWVEEPKSGRLQFIVMSVEPLSVEQRKLNVRIAAQPPGVLDPLRIEYFVEHVLHRRFLNRMHQGMYDQIEYHCLGNGQTWTAPA